MKGFQLCVLAVACLSGGCLAAEDQYADSVPPAPPSAAKMGELVTRLKRLEKTMDALLRQSMLQQLAIEERARGEGDSGVMRVPMANIGTRPYHTGSHANITRAGGLTSDPWKRTGVRVEGLVASMNGVQFRTRTQTVFMTQKRARANPWNLVEGISMPPVPPEVLKQTTVQGQVNEMIEWFKALEKNEYKSRDFRKYFKTVLCYLEGFWRIPEPGFLETTYDTTMKFVNYQLKTGGRTLAPFMGDNLFWDPAKVHNFDGSNIEMAKWTSQVRCQQMKDVVPKFLLRPVDDLTNRMPRRQPHDVYSTMSNARFTVGPLNKPFNYNRHYRTGWLDTLMAQVPGFNGQNGNLTDMAFDSMAMKDKDTPLNAAFYHRYYGVKNKGAMGTITRHRSYSDSSIFMAKTTYPKVSPSRLTDCKRQSGKVSCHAYSDRYSYAIPLALIYLTPLQTWNPHKLPMNQVWTVLANGRNGGRSVDKAWDGVSAHHCATIPPEFLDRPGAWELRGVRTQDGGVRSLAPCGLSFGRRVKGLGSVRDIYPIYPVYDEGNAFAKELEALKDVVMESGRRGHLIRTP